MPDLGSKDAPMQLAGVWCIEYAEMDKIGKTEASRVKSFISTQSDRYRRPYGRVTEDVPRQCVFWGTLNANGNTAYLTDETGNRRFWPVRCADRGRTWTSCWLRGTCCGRRPWCGGAAARRGG